MKKLLMIPLLVFMFSAAAETQDDKDCSGEIRKMRCGVPDDYKAYITCVDLQIEELSDRCQTILIDEMERLKNQGL